MSSGHVVKLGKGTRIKNGRVELRPVYRDASAAIRAKSSKKTKPIKRTP
jgi:hypothetical protein